MLSGLRGVGKTVLLNEFARAAEADGWITIQEEVQSHAAQPLLTSIASQLSRQLKRSAGRIAGDVTKRAIQSVNAFSLTVDPSGSFGFKVDLDQRGTGDLEIDFGEMVVAVAAHAKEHNVGVALFIDELQDLELPALAAIAAASHRASQRSSPFVVCGAGLPDLPGRLAEAKSYAERLYDYRFLGPLDPPTAGVALTAPAVDAGVEWEDDAARHVVEAADRYPYFLQEFGSACWEVAYGPQITDRDARVGIRLGRERLHAGFFRARWDRATPAERRYLVAMARDVGDRIRVGDVAERLGRKVTGLAPTRGHLISKGLVYAPEYGLVAFTVPGMRDFILLQPEAL